MTTTTSFSENKRFMSLYKSILRQNRGIWIFLASVTTVILPFLNVIFYEQIKRRILEGQYYPQSNVDPMKMVASSELYNPVAAVLFTAIMIVCAVIFPIILNSHLFSKKAVDVYHALPVSRQHMLAANTLAGLTIIISVLFFNLASASVIDVIYRGMTDTIFARLFSDIGAWLSVIISCYAISTFAVMGVGTAFNALVYSLAFNFSFSVIMVIADGSFGQFLIGYRGGNLSKTAIKLSPVVTLIEYLVRKQAYAQHEDITANTIALVVWAIIGIALFAVSVAMYLKRKSEFAENTSTNNILGVIIKLIGTFCGSVLFALFLSSVNSSAEKSTFIVGCIIGAVFSYILIEAVLTRGFKTFKRALPLGAAMWAFCIAFCFICITGGLGYEKRLPDADDVKSVTIKTQIYNNSYLESSNIMVGENSFSGVNVADKKMVFTTQSAINTIRDIHSAGYGYEKKLAEKTENNQYAARADQEGFYIGFEVDYKLKNGTVLSRTYSNAPVETAQKFIDLEAEQEFKKNAYPVFEVDAARVAEAHVISADGFNGAKIDKNSYNELLEALRSDILAQDIADKTNPKEQQLGYIYFSEDVSNIPEYIAKYEKFGYDTKNNRIQKLSSAIIYKSFGKTIDVLKKYGLYDKMQSDAAKFNVAYISYEPYDLKISQSQNLYSTSSCFTTAYYAAANNRLSSNINMFDEYYSMQEKYKEMAVAEGKVEYAPYLATAEPKANQLTAEFKTPEQISAIFAGSYLNYSKLDETVFTVMLENTQTKQLAQLKMPLSKAPSFVKDKMAEIIKTYESTASNGSASK